MTKNKKNKNGQNGVTLIEVVVCIAIFAVLSVSVYGIFTSIINGISYYRDKTIVSALADEYLEIVRNMPYSQIGTVEGNPHGTLADLPNKISRTINGIDYQIYYAVSYVDDPADGKAILATDFSPNDYKQVKLYVKNTKTNTENSFSTNVAPKGLEGMASGGALALKVFNAVGEPVPGAVIHIVNDAITPSIDLTRTTDVNGNWVEVGLPDSANNYIITVTKNNYSSDRTYPISAENPNPTKPDATISNGQITQISFSIDQLSDLVFNTLNQACNPISEVGLGVRGSKLIGTTPDVFKFNNSYISNASGQVSLNNIEWDNYIPGLIGNTYMIYGSSPIQQVNILPATSQNFNLILGPKTDNSLLVIVKDASSGNAIEGAEVNLTDGSNTFTGFTNGSVWSQNNWSGGSGQAEFSDSAKYFSDDGNVSTNIIPLGLRLAPVGENYASSGYLESSTFDTGTESTAYTTLTWQPTSQDSATAIKFQIAANNDNETWNFKGPDGTNGSYYDVSGMTINNENNNKYVRYKVFLSTTDQAKTPVLTSVNVNYVSGCAAPGQVMFSGLQTGSNYQTTISMGGYQTQTINEITIEGYNVLQVLLSH
jgi:prepilin-type N-terminal cleavage/methylation domain-containing protein